jgi:hypothetical protein
LYLKPWCIKTFPPRLPDISLAGMITSFIYGGGRLIRFFIPKLGMASVNHDRNSLRRYRSWHVSMYLNVAMFMTFWLTILGNEKKISEDSYICHFFSIFCSPEPKVHMSTLGVRRLSSAINLSPFLLPFLENHWTECNVDHHKYTKHLFGHLANLF